MIISKRFSNPRVFRISQWSRAMRRIIFLGSALWSSSSFAQTSITPTTLSFAKQATNESSSANADAVWKKASADEGLRQAFERTTYSLEDSGHGTYRGVNLTQRLTLEFNGREARLSHPEGSLSFHLTGYGYGDWLQEPARATLTGSGNRLEYRRGDLTEWYLNGSQGLEQGFTLAHRPVPEGATGREDAPMVIALGVTGGLVPTQKTNGDSVQFESSKGVVLRYAGLKASDARGRILPSRLEVRDGQIRLTVEDHDAQYPLIVDPIWTQQQELTASDGVAYDYFGITVSVNGDTAIIGAPNRNSRQGAAYVYVRTDGVWAQQQELTASDAAASSYFGSSVSMSGNTAVIGAPGKTIGSNSGQGAAYVFVRSGGVWSQQQELTASDGAGGDVFGDVVSVNGENVLVGALGKNNYQGAIYVFVGSAGTWSQQQELIASDGAANDRFGNSFSASEGTLVISARQKNSSQGAAYVFVQSAGGWSQQQELTASDGVANDQFGWAVSVSESTAVIGAPYKNGGQGAAYVFVNSGGGWSQQQELTASDGAADFFGGAVSVSGSTAIIGAPSKAIGANSGQGAAYVFTQSAAMWSQQQELTASDGAANDQFGWSVSLSGGSAVIGDYKFLPSVPGAAYVFVRPKLGTNALLVGSAGGGSSVVLSFSGPWTATANDTFLHLSAGSFSGTGSSVVVFTYDQFLGTGTRTGTLTIAGLTLTVTQAGTNYIGPGPVTTLVSSAFSNPTGVAVDVSGNVYIADSEMDIVNQWSASTQQVTTLVSATTVVGVAVDGFGNVFIADGGISVSEWNASTQQVTTLVSQESVGGTFQPRGVAVDGSGNVYIAATGNQAIEEWNASTQQVTTLVSSGLNNPYGVAVDGAGNVYIADSFNNAIKERSASTQQVTTLVSSGLNNPFGVAVDGSGNVYIADTGNQAIKEWSASTQQVTTLVSSGLNNPYGVAVDGAGDVYIADARNNAIKEIPNAFVGPASFTEPAAGGSDSLLQVLPAETSLVGIFAPTSDQSWLTIGTITSGVIDFSFTANTSGAARAAHITVLGQQITVTQTGLTAQTITFGALSNQVLGAAPFTVSATASSGLTVSFNSQTTPVCTVSGVTVTLVAVGTCTIQATQAGDGITYAAATPVNQSFQVTQAIQNQTITFGVLVNQPFGSAPFTVSATASSGLTVSFASTTPAVCTVSVATVTLVALGVCTIQATQPGNANYPAATPVNQSFEVTFQGLGTSALLLGSAGGSSSVVLTYSGAWTATANASFLHISAGSTSGTGSGLVVFTYDPFTGTGTRTGTLTIAGLTLTVTQAGTNYIGPGPVTTLVSSGLNLPYGVAVDGSGNVYIADSFNSAIKKWSASTQQVTTLVSSGLNQPYGVAVDGFGNVYIADFGNNAIYEWSASTQQVTTLVSSGLNQPFGVAVDASGNVYIADYGSSTIKEWNASTQQVTTLVSGLFTPFGVAVDSSGNVYIADTRNGAVKEWSPSTQQVTTLVSSGLNGGPSGVAVDGSGNVYIADINNNAIYEWSAATQQVTTLVSSGLSGPIGVAVDGSGNVYIADTTNNAIKEIPNAFVGPASLSEPASAGSDSLLPVLPATISLAGIFAPSSDQSWLTIGTITSGVINFSFTANTSTSARTAHIAVLGQQITVTQNGLAATTLTPATLSFGSQTVNEPSSPKTATFKNAQAVALTISSITVSGANPGDFVSGGTCPVSPSTLGAGKSCSITVTFTPSMFGSETATLTVTHSAPTSPQTVALTGTGIAPVTLAPSTLNLGTVAVGDTSAAKAVTLTNHQNVALNFSSILTSAGFAVASNTCGASIVAGATCTVGVTFSPTVAGAAAGTLTFTDNAANSPQAVGLTGTGSTPVTLAPSTLNLGTVAVGDTSAAKTVTLTNHQNLALNFSSILTSAGFAVASNTCGASIVAGATCTVGVTFSPTANGAATGTLTFSDNAANSPQAVSLTGTGNTPVTLSASTLNFGTVVVGNTSATKTVTLTSHENVALNFSSIVASAGFVVASNTCSPRIAAAATCTVGVTFSPTATGASTGTLTFADDATNNPQTVTLTGTGSSPVTVSPTSLTFASLKVGTTSAAKTVILTNHLSAALTVSAIVANGDFVVASNTCGSSVGAGLTCTVGVTFTPTAVGARSGSLTINNGAFGSPLLVPLTGTGK